MNNDILQIKVKERLNKLDSDDYPNLPCWSIAEAFNKAQSAWVRRQLQGINHTKTGAESSTRRIDDLQVLLTTLPMALTDKGIYWESPDIPTDYMQYNLLSAKAVNSCCPPRPLQVFLAESSKVDMFLRDTNRRPNYEWATTFTTIQANKFRLYTNDNFDVQECELLYFRNPRNIQILGCIDPYTNNTVTVAVESELPDAVVELIIDETCAILGGDTDSVYQQQRNAQEADGSN